MCQESDEEDKLQEALKDNKALKEENKALKEANKTCKADYKKAKREKTAATEENAKLRLELETLQKLAEQENKPAGSARGKRYAGEPQNTTPVSAAPLKA